MPPTLIYKHNAWGKIMAKTEKNNLTAKAKPKTSKKKRSKASATRALTKRELEVLKHLVMGKSNTKIGEELNISSHTVKAHVCTILRKMAVTDRVQIAVKAVREGLVK